MENRYDFSHRELFASQYRIFLDYLKMRETNYIAKAAIDLAKRYHFTLVIFTTSDPAQYVARLANSALKNQEKFFQGFIDGIAGVAHFSQEKASMFAIAAGLSDISQEDAQTVTKNTLYFGLMATVQAYIGSLMALNAQTDTALLANLLKVLPAEEDRFSLEYTSINPPAQSGSDVSQ